jgi:programmed cell death 6-interacting protein
MLEVLSSGRDAMESYIPNAVATRWNPQVERAMGDLRQALSRARGLEQHRYQYVKQLMASVAKTDLMPEIVSLFRDLQAADPYRKIDAATFESVYTSSLSQFDVNLAWVRQQSAEQSALVESIRQRNETFNELYETDAVTKDRQSAIQCLEVAYFKFHTVKANLEEGRVFYNQILGQLTKFVKDCDGFVFVRRKDGREREQQAVNSAVSFNGDDDNQQPATVVAAPRAQSRVNVNLWKHDGDIKFG